MSFFTPDLQQDKNNKKEIPRHNHAQAFDKPGINWWKEGKIG